MDQVGYLGDPNFLEAAEGKTPRPADYAGVGTDSKPATERPVFGKTEDEKLVRGRKRH